MSLGFDELFVGNFISDALLVPNAEKFGRFSPVSPTSIVWLCFSIDSPKTLFFLLEKCSTNIFSMMQLNHEHFFVPPNNNRTNFTTFGAITTIAYTFLLWNSSVANQRTKQKDIFLLCLCKIKRNFFLYECFS